MHASASDTSRRPFTLNKQTKISLGLLFAVWPIVSAVATFGITRARNEAAIVERVKSLTENQRGTVHQEEFDRAVRSIEKRLDEMREDLRDIKRATAH